MKAFAIAPSVEATNSADSFARGTREKQGVTVIQLGDLGSNGIPYPLVTVSDTGNSSTACGVDNPPLIGEKKVET